MTQTRDTCHLHRRFSTLPCHHHVGLHHQQVHHHVAQNSTWVQSLQKIRNRVDHPIRSLHALATHRKSPSTPSSRWRRNKGGLLGSSRIAHRMNRWHSAE